jgi:cobalt-zinc-cadmium efflux system membrane fusion protein
VLEAILAQAKAQFNLTQTTLRRDEALYKAEFISKQELDVARASNQSAETDIDAAIARIAREKSRILYDKSVLSAAGERNTIAAEALSRARGIYNGGYLTNQQVVAAEATWQQAKLDVSAAANAVRLLGGTPGGGDVITVRAPFGGHVTERLVTLGETVSAGETLFKIINLNTVWVQLNLYTEAVPMVHVGQRVTITSNTDPGHIFLGTVSYIGESVDPTTRTVKVRCVIRNGNDLLKLGGFVQGEIIKPFGKPVLVVPKEAVQDFNSDKVVFKVGDKQGEFIACPVQVGDTDGKVTEIRAGLKSGDRIVTRNAFIVESQAIKSELGGGDD